MRIAIITTEYQPLRSSGAVQMRDLAGEFLRQGHEPILLVPASTQHCAWRTESLDGVCVLRLAAPRIKEVSHFRRAVGEIWMPFQMLYGIWRSGFCFDKWDAVVWNSPSIFFGPLVAVLKYRSRCRTYLIQRDMFPEWLLDLGLLRRGPAYYFFKCVAFYQYGLADTIGIQTASNLSYFQYWTKRDAKRVEVLANWLTVVPLAGSSIQIGQTSLAGRTILIYIGNMGIAQGMDILIELAHRLRMRSDVGFLFVGRGTDLPRLRANAIGLGLDNILFHPEVDPGELPALLAQCHVGLLALDPRHKSHNIPGKFLTYMQAGLPVLARINPDTDLEGIIDLHAVGRIYNGMSADEIRPIAELLIDDLAGRQQMSVRARALSEQMFSSMRAVNQIIGALCPTQ